MRSEILLAYFHFVSIFGLASTLVAELLLCRPGLRGDQLHRLKHVDAAYAVFAVAVLASGAARVIWGVKGAAYYGASNPVFHVKFGLFVLIGLISIVPTVRFLRWSKAARQDAGFTPPASAVAGVRRMIHAELLLLAAMPLLAAMVARGVTAFSAG